MSNAPSEPGPEAESAKPASVRSPRLLLIALAGLALALVALAWGFYELGARRDAAPEVIAVDKADLEEALYESPWISSGGLGLGDEGRAASDEEGVILWVVAAPNCEPCRRFERGAMGRLIDAGVEVRIIVTAPRSMSTQTETAREIAALTKDRDWTALDLWLQGKDEALSPMDAAEADGMLEWGRQSQERIADVLQRNDLTLKAPALFWKNGPEWRAAIAADDRALTQIERELAPGT